MYVKSERFGALEVHLTLIDAIVLVEHILGVLAYKVARRGARHCLQIYINYVHILV